MLSLRNRSIRSSLAFLILSASALAVLLASIGFAVYEHHSDRASGVRELTALADTLGANTAASLAFDDQATAKQMLQALATEPHVLAACLYSDHSRLFSDYRRNGSPTVLSCPTKRPDGAYFDRQYLTLFHGVFLNGDRTGTIALVYDLSEFRSRLLQYVKIAIIVLILSVLITFVISLRLAHSIGDPLVKLAALARRISSEKDYSVRAEISARGETGLLVRSFNEMLSRMEDTLHSLQESEERYALAARGANDGLWDWNLVSNEIYFSPRWNHMLGLAETERWSDPEVWFSHIHVEDRERVRSEIAAHCDGKTPEFVSEYRMRHQSGRYIWTLSRGIAIRDDSGKSIRMAGSQTDITEGKIADALTGIPNRLYFIDRLESAIETAQRQGTLFAVLFVDLDQFKLVNDSLGHAAGDELLIDVAGRLRSSIRAGSRSAGSTQSFVARLGGDEFAVLVGQIQHEADASVVAARILERLTGPFHFDGRRMFISASIGIALSTSGSTPEDILRNADTAMYHAKISGKSRFEFFNEGLRERIITRFETETGLRKAIDSQQLILHYQPIVSLREGRILGFEALVRWNHPERGLVPPIEFIPIAEESDLIVHLGRWVLREACRQFAVWQKTLSPEAPLTVSVNVSSRQLTDARLVDDVDAALAESGLAPECLALELTESAVMGNAEETLATLNRLRERNIKLEIDDFGTGYSSLSYLQRLPFSVLKIDRSFIREMSDGNGSLDIVRAIVELAHSLKLEVIAEGVEEEDQLCHLRGLACDYYQGYLFSKPLEPAAAEQLLRHNHTLELICSATSNSQ